MKSSYMDHKLSWIPIITTSPSLPLPPSSPSSYAGSPPFPDLQVNYNMISVANDLDKGTSSSQVNNMISVQLVANDLDKGTSSSPSEALIYSLHKRSANQGHSNASSLSSSSDFEFGSCCLSEINDDPPISPKLICPSTPNAWGRPSNDGRLEVIMQQNNPLIPSSRSHTPVQTNARHQPSAPSSPSAGQLVAEESSGDHKGYDFDFNAPSSAPQTPNLQQKQEGQLVKQRRLSQDNSSLRVLNINDDRRRSKSAVWDRRLSPLMMQNSKQQEVYLAGGLDLISSSSSCNESSAVQYSVDINEQFDILDQAATNKIIKNHSSSESNKKWAFKDLLRKTVPSSKADRPHHNQAKYRNPNIELPIRQFDILDQAATNKIFRNHSSSDSNKKWAFEDLLRKTVPSSKADRPHHNQPKYRNPNIESPIRQSKSSSISSPKPHYLLSGLRKSALMSTTAASPPRGSAAAAAVKETSTLPDRPSPTRSPRRPPMSPHGLHYKNQKARSEELKRKTFLPYSRSVLGCFGDATMSLQQVR